MACSAACSTSGRSMVAELGSFGTALGGRRALPALAPRIASPAGAPRCAADGGSGALGICMCHAACTWPAAAAAAARWPTPRRRCLWFLLLPQVRLGDPEQLAKIMETDPYFITQVRGRGRSLQHSC